MRYFALVLLMLVGFGVCAQQKDNENQLALLYYSKGEYQKAVPIYESLYKQTHSHIYFDYLIQCYIYLQQLDNAVRTTQEQIKFYPNSYYYQIKLGGLWQMQQKQAEAKQLYDRIIKKVSKSDVQTIEAAQAAFDNQQLDLAQTILENGVKRFPANVSIHKLLAKLYLQQQQFDKLVRSYMDLLIANPFEKEFIESELQYLIYENNKIQIKDLLQRELQQYLEKNPHAIEMSELQIWLFIQEKSFRRAFLIARAFDMRHKEDGERVYSLGQLALSNADYAVATDCFSYVMTKGVENQLYVPALKLLLETSYSKLFVLARPPKNQVVELETQYSNALKQLGKNQTTVDVMRNLAYIQAFYLHSFDQAVVLLQEALEIPNMPTKERGLTQMTLADVYLLQNDIWSANLLYAKVALQSKSTDIGHQARLMQARIAYFNGQFEYAQALLDILKASTSKLIANDAFELAQLISDNTVFDTTFHAMELFAKADLLTFQNQDSLAFVYLDSIVALYPGHTLEDDILMRKAIISKKIGNYTEMKSYLQAIVDRFSYEIYADNALFMLAEYYEFVEQNNQQAQEYYKKIMFEHPSSYYNSIARKRYRESLRP